MTTTPGKISTFLQNQFDDSEDTNKIPVIAQQSIEWFKEKNDLEKLPQMLSAILLLVLDTKLNQFKYYYRFVQEIDRQMNTNHLYKIIFEPLPHYLRKIKFCTQDGQINYMILSILEWAVCDGRVNIVDFLLTQHEDEIDSKNIHGDTLFHVAMCYSTKDNIKMLQLLLSKIKSSRLETILQHKNAFKQNLLHTAVCRAQTSSVHYLFEKKYYSFKKEKALFFIISNNLITNTGNTYPHRYEMLKMAEYLLQKSPRILLHDNIKGQRPYNLLLENTQSIVSHTQGNTDLNAQEKETIQEQLTELYLYLVTLMMVAKNCLYKKPLYSVNWTQPNELASQKKIGEILNEGKKKYEIAQHYNAMIKKNQWSCPSISVSEHYLSYPKGVEFFHRCISDEQKQQRFEITRWKVNKRSLPAEIIFIITRFFIQNLLDEPNTAKLLKEVYPIIDTTSFNHQFYSMLNGLFESQVSIPKTHILTASKETPTTSFKQS